MKDFRTLLKRLHFFSAVCFILSLAYILVLSLRQAGVDWWVIFSLSGYSLVIAGILTSLYLFAMFRGVSGSQYPTEHPLTSSGSYMIFYIISPFLGVFAGYIGSVGSGLRLTEFLLGIALTTLGTTFIVWIVLDPLIGLIEMMMPASRKHRSERIAAAHKARIEKETAKEKMLNGIILQELSHRQQWKNELTESIAKLCTLLEYTSDTATAKRQVVQIGSEAWRKGGLSCMQTIHEAAMDTFQTKHNKEPYADFIAVWWDGIGNWKSKFENGKVKIS